MADENNTDSDSSDDKFCSAAEEGTSSDDGKTIIKRRKVEEWVIPNPVETALHPTMDLQGKRNKIMTELVGQQLTEALNQHSLNLNILVPVIAAWDETLTEYTAKLLNEIERRKQHMQHLDDRYSRTLQKQVNNTAAVPLPSNNRRAALLAERLSTTRKKREAIAEGISTLECQHGTLQTLLNSMADYTTTALAEIECVTNLIRSNARTMIRSTIASQLSQETNPSVAASSDGAARQINPTQSPRRGDTTGRRRVDTLECQWLAMATPSRCKRGG